MRERSGIQAMDVYHFKNFEMLDPEAGELRGGHELVVEGDTIKEVSAKPIKLGRGRRHRLRRAHADARPDRQPCACGAVRGRRSATWKACR